MGYEIKDEATLNEFANTIGKALSTTEDALRETKEQVGQLAGLQAEVKDLQKQFADIARRPAAGAKALPWGEAEQKSLTLEAVHKAPSGLRHGGKGSFRFDAPDKDDPVGKFQEACDELYLLGAYLKLVDADGNWKRSPSGLRFYQEKFAPARDNMLGLMGKANEGFGAGSGLAGTGYEWVPTELSARLIEKVRLELLVASLFEEIPVSRAGTFEIPSWLNDLTAKLVTETADMPPSGTGSNLIPIGYASTDSITSKVTFSASKLGLMAFASKEVEEDAAIAILPFLSRAVVFALRNGIENAIINGDTAGTHMDADVTSAVDVRKAWDGLRDYALNTGTAKKDASGAYINTDANWRDYVRGALGLMGKYGVNHNRVALIASPSGANQIGSVEAFRTVYAFGGQSTNQNPGAVSFRPDGMNFIASEFARDTVAATGVNTALGPNTSTTLLLVHQDAWALAAWRRIALQVLTERYAEYDVDAVKVTARYDFQPLLSGNHTGIVYGVTA